MGAALVPVRRGRSAAPLLVLVLAAAVSFGSLLAAGINKSDEVWNLHLIDRMVHGEVLYRDLRYFPTPLAMFVGVGAAALLGVRILVFKALVAVAFGVTAAASLGVVRVEGAGRRAQALVVVLLLLFALPPASSLYNTLAITFTALTALTVLRWDAALADPHSAARSRRLFLRAIGVGVATGACLLTKYNVGAAVAVAVAGSFAVALAQRRAGLREFCASAATAAGAAILTFLAGMVPVILQGAGPAFVSQLLEGRSLIDAPVPYAEGWESLIDGVGRLAAPDMRTFAAYALVPLAGLASIVAVARTKGVDRGRLLVLAMFTLAAAVLAVPRADHVTWMVPLPIALLVVSLLHLFRPLAQARPVAAVSLRSLCLGFVATWLALSLLNEAAAARAFERVPAGPFEGALLPAGRWREIERDATEIRSRIGTDGKVFILSQEAGLLYMAGGMRNPTPYDYPDAFEFGTDGVAKVRAALVNYTINFTCISTTFAPGLEPVRVIATVRARSRPVAKLRACELWATGVAGSERRP